MQNDIKALFEVYGIDAEARVTTTIDAPISFGGGGGGGGGGGDNPGFGPSPSVTNGSANCSSGACGSANCHV